MNIITTNPYRTSQALLFRGAVGNNSKYYNGKNFINPTKSTIVGGYPDSNNLGVGYKKDDIVKLVGGSGGGAGGAAVPATFEILSVDIKGRVKRVRLVTNGDYSAPIANSQDGVLTTNQSGSGSGLKLIPRWNQDLQFTINKLAGPHVGDIKIEKPGTWVKSITEISPGIARAMTNFD